MTMTLEEDKTFASRILGLVLAFAVWGGFVLLIVWMFG